MRVLSGFLAVAVLLVLVASQPASASSFSKCDYQATVQRVEHVAPETNDEVAGEPHRWVYVAVKLKWPAPTQGVVVCKGTKLPVPRKISLNIPESSRSTLRKGAKLAVRHTVYMNFDAGGYSENWLFRPVVAAKPKGAGQKTVRPKTPTATAGRNALNVAEYCLSNSQAAVCDLKGDKTPVFGISKDGRKFVHWDTRGSGVDSCGRGTIAPDGVRMVEKPGELFSPIKGHLFPTTRVGDKVTVTVDRLTAWKTVLKLGHNFTPISNLLGLAPTRAGNVAARSRAMLSGPLRGWTVAVTVGKDDTLQLTLSPKRKRKGKGKRKVVELGSIAAPILPAPRGAPAAATETRAKAATIEQFSVIRRGKTPFFLVVVGGHSGVGCSPATLRYLWVRAPRAVLR